MITKEAREYIEAALGINYVGCKSSLLLQYIYFPSSLGINYVGCKYKFRWTRRWREKS